MNIFILHEHIYNFIEICNHILHIDGQYLNPQILNVLLEAKYMESELKFS